MNDVIDFVKYYNGRDESPYFFHEYLDARRKLFIPIDDVSLGEKLCKNTRERAILHHFVADCKQNRLLCNPKADSALHKKFYAVCSPDPSVDSKNCWGCLNNANILKARIIAYLWQQAEGERVILTLIWGDGSTYKYAFGNIEKGTIVAVSHQGVVDEAVFKDGLLFAIDTIQSEAICWYGSIPEYVYRYYDKERIIKMQARNTLKTELFERHKKQERAILLLDDILYERERSFKGANYGKQGNGNKGRLC